MLKMMIAAGALASLTVPAVAGEYNATGRFGGTVSGVSECERVGSAVVCNGSGKWVGPEGAERERTSSRVFTRDTATGSKTVTGVGGRERVVEWTRERRDLPRRN